MTPEQKKANERLQELLRDKTTTHMKMTCKVTHGPRQDAAKKGGRISAAKRRKAVGRTW